MAIDVTTARSRRAILAAGLGGLAASLASALGHPAPSRAAAGDPVLLSAGNLTAAGKTIIENEATNNDALVAVAFGTGTALAGETETGIGVYGTGGIGLKGYSASGYGVHGISTSSDAVHGESGTHYGVYGTSTSQAGVYGDSANHPGVVGHSDNSIGVSGSSPNGTGVYGSSGLGPGVSGYSNATNRAGAVGQSGGDSTGVLGVSGSPVPDAPAKTGVFGEADQDATAKGVWGKSAAGRGVYGEASNGQGVRGYSASGAALYGSTSGAKAGYALRTDGRVRFDKSAGLATVTSGHKTVTVTPGIDLTSTSAVVATLQGNPSGTIAVQAVAVDPSADTFTIYLNATAASDLKVAWHAFG